MSFQVFVLIIIALLALPIFIHQCSEANTREWKNRRENDARKGAESKDPTSLRACPVSIQARRRVP